MMCDDCGIRPASIHLTTIANGAKQERNLCPECLAKMQKQLPSLDLSSLSGILAGILGAAKGSAGPKQPEPDIKCERCGMTYAAFKKTGLLGCADCYKAFEEPLRALLTRVHGHTQHVGRVPGGVDSTLSVKLNVETCKQDLVKAIAAEEYERAAELRDKIRALKAQLAESEAKEASENG